MTEHLCLYSHFWGPWQSWKILGLSYLQRKCYWCGQVERMGE